MPVNNRRKIKTKLNFGISLTLLLYLFDFGLWNTYSCGCLALGLHTKIEDQNTMKGVERRKEGKQGNLGIDDSTNIQKYAH